MLFIVILMILTAFGLFFNTLYAATVARGWLRLAFFAPAILLVLMVLGFAISLAFSPELAGCTRLPEAGLSCPGPIPLVAWLNIIGFSMLYSAGIALPLVTIPLFALGLWRNRGIA